MTSLYAARDFRVNVAERIRYRPITTFGSQSAIPGNVDSHRLQHRHQDRHGRHHHRFVATLLVEFSAWKFRGQMS